MAVTIYQSKKKTEEKMNAYFAQMVQDGKTLLPTELELCDLLSASRNVIRDLLRRKEERGEIIRKPRGRALPLHPVTAGRFGFFVCGVNMPGNPTWNKLWLCLQQNAVKYNLTPELYLFPWNVTQEKIRRILRETPDTVILVNGIQKVKSDVFMTGNKNRIYVDEDFLGLDGSLIALDNYETGVLAAKELHAKGYRRPALISFKIKGLFTDEYRMYTRRNQGFTDGCRNLGMEFSGDRDIFRLHWPYSICKRIALVMDFIRSAILNSRYDSLFINTDTDINLFYDAIVSSGIRIPEDIGLLTVNSFDYAVTHDPVVSSISTATCGIAEKLLSFISDLANKKLKGNVTFYIPPTIHKGETL